jgi:DNA-binding XRE family transcriptional regulator
VPANPRRLEKAVSELARCRIESGVSQRELAYVVGISVPTLVRLEAKRVKNPPISWYVNCAIALGVTLDDVLEEGLLDDHPQLRRQWTELNTRQLPPEDWCKRVHDGSWHTPARTPAARRLQGRPD